MIVSHKHKFIFLKTRKTASTSTELALYPYCDAGDIVTPLTPSALTRHCGHHAQHHIRPLTRLDPRPLINHLWSLEGFKFVDFHDHIRAAEVRDYVGERVWRSYYKFAFERNVFDRQVSWFHYRTSNAWRKWRWPDFKTFLSRSPEAQVDNHRIYTIDGEVAVDFVGRYEQLGHDLHKVLETLGLKPPAGDLPRAKSEHRPCDRGYRTYYDRESRDLVASWYPAELRLFDHRF